MMPHLYGLPRPGDRVGDYRIVGLLGEGGHGHVYRAEAFGRSFAVKFLDPGLEAFGKREVQALMELDHPGVVRFVACGRWRDPVRGLFYVVMELVEGLTLHDYLLEYNPTGRKVGEMMLSLGGTLLAVEEAGVLHRDVKCENIVVRLPSQQPVLVDFGLSTLRGASSSGGKGGVTGTLEYLSPEAWKHMRDEEERYRPTAKDEQWALGVTFYWMLTDLLPFGARTDPLMTRRVLRVQPKAPHVINPRVPPELGAVCMRMLEKEPQQRYADLREMCGAVRGALEGAAGVERWEVPLGDPDAPECRTTEIDPAILAEQGIEWELSKLRLPRRGRVQKRPALYALAGAPAEPPPEFAAGAEAEPAPLPGPAAVIAAAPGAEAEPVAEPGLAAIVVAAPVAEAEPVAEPGRAAAVVAAAIPEPAPLPLGALGERQGSVTALAQASVAPEGSRFRRAARGAAAWTSMLVLGFVLGPTPLLLEPSERPERMLVLSSAQGLLCAGTPAPGLLEQLALWPPQMSSALLPAGEASGLAAWQVGALGQKLAPALHSHEAVPGAALTPASVAEATFPQDEPDVKTPVKKTGLGSVKKAAAAAVAAMALGCPAPQVRPPPEPMECPAGSLENMEKLGLKRGDEGRFRFESAQVDAGLTPVQEGWTSFRALESWETEPRIKRLSGKLLFGGGRVYGRLTQATLSNGTTLRVCIELVGQNHFNEDLSLQGPLERGLPCLPTSSADTVKVASSISVRVVDHFE